MTDTGLGADPSSPGATIQKVHTYSLHVPLRRTLADALYTRTHWHIPVVEITTKDGLVGTGYSGVWAGDDIILKTIDRYISDAISGRDSTRVAQLWDEVYWSPLHWVGRGGVAHMALGMVDMALWDLAAQRAELPLWKLLGGRHDRLETYNTDGGWLNFTMDELLEDTSRMVNAGWSRVKMKIGGPDPRLDLERVAQLRSSLPPSVTIMVDVNQSWDLYTAMRFAPRLAELDIAWLEEPLHPDDVGGHATLASAGHLPLALGENIYAREQFQAFLDSNAVDVVQVDVTRVAGITEWLRIAHAAQARSRSVVPHAGDMMQVHQHLVAGVADGRTPLIEFLGWGLEVFDQPIDLRGSEIVLPTVPGASSAIGVEARKRWLAK
jgi:L-alanine-DL-glutamate epimerase-like enolase superfamily enzyme